MESSDSDDDCYGDIGRKLQLIRNQYKYNKMTHKSLDVSTDSIACIKGDDKCIEDSYEETTIDSIIAKNTKRKRPTTRSVSKQLEIEISDPPTRTKRNATKSSRLSKANHTIDSNKKTNPKQTGAGKRKQTTEPRTRSTRIAENNLGYEQNIPTYSIGNTSHYPDFSGTQQLFTAQQSNETVTVQDDECQSINEELSVKVIWQSSECRTFNIRKYQKFTEIYDYYANKENVSHKNLVFMYQDGIIKSEDTPAKIDYNIVKFIEGGITSTNMLDIFSYNTCKGKKGMKLKFRLKNIKKPFEVTVEADETLSLAMIQCAEHYEIPLKQLKFIFDGDHLLGTSTPKDLDMEGGECIDVKISS